MKKIEAIIQPHKLDQVKEALTGIGIDGMTISEVRGHGRQKGHKEIYRGQEYNVDLIPKIKLELVVLSSRAEEVIRTLSAAARSGNIGDGKIFVSDIAEAVRIRNDERERRHCDAQQRFRLISSTGAARSHINPPSRAMPVGHGPCPEATLI